MTIQPDKIIKQTQCWIKSVIVAFEFCPFAKRELERGSIHYEVISSSTQNSDNSERSIMTAALVTMQSEFKRLDENKGIETSFIIFENQFSDFYIFLDLLDLANKLLESENYDGIYQIASFHPEYCFSETSSDDASNFTNRSPYPMLHLLRESSLTTALENFSEPEEIPLHNIKKAREQGNAVFKSLLSDCLNKK